MVPEQMYATGYRIRPLSSSRLRPAGRPVAVVLAALGASVALAVVAHGGSAGVDATIVVQPGDTLWSIAAERYPADDVRARVLDIEQANGLSGPSLDPGQTLRLPR
jgi:LysM repeat protein